MRYKILKIISLLIISILIFFFLWLANGFFGNPISKALSDRSIRNYVEDNYSDLDLELDKSKYNFKYASYMARAYSKTNPDIHFVVYYNDGSVTGDSYDNYVLSKVNTLNRLSEDYSDLAKSIISDQLGLNEFSTNVRYRENGNFEEVITLGMEFNRNIPLEAEVSINISYLEDHSLINISNILENAHQAFINNNCYFSTYSFYTEIVDGHIMVNNVTVDDIESGNLAELLENSVNKDHLNGIRVSIMNKG